MEDIRTLLSRDSLNPTTTENHIREFERHYGVDLPDEYKSFITNISNGGRFGPEYGLLPFEALPIHWAAVHDYLVRLSKPFPLTEEWVWEDAPQSDEITARVGEVENGVLLLGEEGCGTRWVLVVSGSSRGEVWLLTGEVATPCRPRMNFEAWLRALVSGGASCWHPWLRDWGPQPNIWFYSHAIKKMLVINLKKPASKNGIVLSQNMPLCADCRAFLSRAAIHYQRQVHVKVPVATWIFNTDGRISRTN